MSILPRPPLKSFKVLENDLVRLEIFDLPLHGPSIIAAAKSYPEDYTYTLGLPMDSPANIARLVRTSEGEKCVMYAVIDKVGIVEKGEVEGGGGGGEGNRGEVAGYIGLVNTDFKNLSSEIALVIFKPYHRTHVTTNAVGLLLLHSLDPYHPPPSSPTSTSPSHSSPSSLGLRRISWTAHASNVASISAAQRLGFRLEGVMRWSRVLGPTKQGSEISEERRTVLTEGERDVKIRHSALLALCWDDWLVEGGREVVLEKMKRREGLR